MSWQTLFTALIVAACAGCAAWQLMPAALRARCRAVLGLKADAAGGCGACDNCGAPAAPRADGAQVVKIVRRGPAARGG
jgi:hypothetical protein